MQKARAKLSGRFTLTARRPDGSVAWIKEACNLVVDEALNYLLDVALSGGTPDTSWFIGLTDGTPTVAAGDTLASHAGWVEVTAYSGNRKAWVDGGVASQSVDNVASPAEFTISADGTTIGGAFLCGVNTGTSGLLYCAAAFTGGDESLDQDFVLEVTYTATAEAA